MEHRGRRSDREQDSELSKQHTETNKENKSTELNLHKRHDIRNTGEAQKQNRSQETRKYKLHEIQDYK